MLPKGFAASASTGWAAEGSHRRTGVLPSLGGVRGLLQASTFPSGKASMWMVTIGRLTGAGHAPPRAGGGAGVAPREHLSVRQGQHVDGHDRQAHRRGPRAPRRGGSGRNRSRRRGRAGRGSRPAAIAVTAATAAGSQRTRKQQNPDAHHVTLHANPFPGYGRKLRHKTASSEDAAGE